MTPTVFRRVSLTGLTLLLTAVLAVAVAGCGPAPSSSTTGATRAAASSPASATAAVSTLTFDLSASKAGRPRTAAESTLTAPWFPPPGTDGLRRQLDKKRIVELVHAISTNGQFWIERSNDHIKPLVYGADAVSVLARSIGFSAGTVVPVLSVTGVSGGQPVLGSAPTGYQVLLSGNIGDTSFGVRPGTKKGEWLLDPNGELVTWSGAIDAVGSKAGFVSTSAAVVHTAFDLEGKTALYLSWAVFRDAKGRQWAVSLHSPPPLKATWAIGNGEPLQLGRVYDMKTITSQVTITLTR